MTSSIKSEIHCLYLLLKIWPWSRVRMREPTNENYGIGTLAIDTPLRGRLLFGKRGVKEGMKRVKRKREREFRLILNGYRRALCEAGQCCCSFISFQWERLSCVYLTLHCYFARSWTREKGTGIIEPYIESRISLLFNPLLSFSTSLPRLSFSFTPQSLTIALSRKERGTFYTYEFSQNEILPTNPDLVNRSTNTWLGKIKNSKVTKKLRKVMYSLSTIIARSIL